MTGSAVGGAADPDAERRSCFDGEHEGRAGQCVERDAHVVRVEAAGQPVDPNPAVGIEHHLDDAGIFEIAGDRRSERGAQHARAAGEGFGSEGDRRHGEPRKLAWSKRIDQRG